MNAEEFHVRSGEVPPCGRCGRQGLLLVSFPHAWENASGQTVAGFKEAVLCSCCHKHQPDAGDLIDLLQANGSMRPEEQSDFAALAAAWIESERLRTVDVDALDDEFRRWQADEL
ncbi:DUF6300 family protein [Streptomyces sp. NPDC091040]|uniref:DUF6300 family protein n=1 Tax=Streptomyces sp. NPDC091040 TaxID=3365972 RepID=UPI003829A21B